MVFRIFYNGFNGFSNGFPMVFRIFYNGFNGFFQWFLGYFTMVLNVFSNGVECLFLDILGLLDRF